MGRPFKPMNMKDFEKSQVDKKADEKALKKVNSLRKEAGKVVEKEHMKAAKRR